MSSEHQQAEEMRDDVPSTIARSDDKAVRTYKKTLESAEESYGDAERAHRAAFAALKHTYEKVGEYTATLTVTNAKGQKGTDEIDIFVETD